MCKMCNPESYENQGNKKPQSVRFGALSILQAES